MQPNDLGEPGSFGLELAVDPCGELHLVVAAHANGVMFSFCQPVSWLDMTPESALAVGTKLIEEANKVLAMQASTTTHH